MTVGLLERESTGGATARVGFEYQDAYVLQSLPRWLAQSAFSHVVSEAVGDVEVCYFGPDAAVRRMMLEAKDYALTAPAFWEEVQRFKNAHSTSPLEFVRFGLVCRDYNTKTSPFIEKLARLRGVGSSYQSNSVILEQDRKDVIEWARTYGHPVELAEFALQHVDFVTYAAGSADAAFPGELEQHLPSIDLSGKESARLRDLFKRHIARSSSSPVQRKELEADICSVLDERGDAWLSTPTRVQLGGGASFELLSLDVETFNGPERGKKSPEEWSTLSRAAAAAASFIKTSTGRGGVLLDGKQRMSTACLLGHAFTAAGGFTLRVEHNGNVFRTDLHEKAAGTFFSEVRRPGDSLGGQGVACLGFPSPVGSDASLARGGGLAGLPMLSLESGRAVGSQEEMNLAVAEAKAALMSFRAANRLELLHLFVKAPSAFAMLLGHRLNGICKVQLYDWVNGQYCATAILDAA